MHDCSETFYNAMKDVIGILWGILILILIYLLPKLKETEWITVSVTMLIIMATFPSVFLFALRSAPKAMRSLSNRTSSSIIIDIVWRMSTVGSYIFAAFFIVAVSARGLNIEAYKDAVMIAAFHIIIMFFLIIAM